jgi:DNA-binding transcriptional LysR family regulator
MNNYEFFVLWRRRMDLSDLRIFAAVVREGGVTRAATHLHRVPSNVTTRIRQLEDDLGCALFVRAGKRLHVAPAGQILLDYADRLLALAQEARAAVLDSRPRGLFRLGAMDSTAAVRLPRLIAEFGRRYPEVAFELRTANPPALAAAVLAGELEAALVAEPAPAASFEQVVAFREEVVIVAAAGHPAIGKNGFVPKTMIVFEHGCPHRKRLEAWYESLRALPERTIELGSYHAMLGCVVAGMGAALLPRSVLSTFPERRRLSIHPLPRGQRGIATLLIWRKGVNSPKVRALVQILASKPALNRIP